MTLLFSFLVTFHKGAYGKFDTLCVLYKVNHITWGMYLLTCQLSYFLLWFYVKKRAFSVKLKQIISLFQTKKLQLRLIFSSWTADVPYCSDMTLFLYATSDRLSPTMAFSLCQFLALYCYKINLASFSRYAVFFFYLRLSPLNMLNKTKLMRNG